MNRVKIGAFIASRRKKMGLTRAELAERLGISERAVSKWETGKCMPDSGIMLKVCKLLDISVNELLSGEKIMSERYDEKAEEKLAAMKMELEEKNRLMLRLELWILLPTVIAAVAIIFLAEYAVTVLWAKNALIAILIAMLFTVAFVGTAIEQKAGYYECRHCHHRYVPTYRQVNLAMHAGTTRYMKCPECGKRSWQKKALTKED